MLPGGKESSRDLWPALLIGIVLFLVASPPVSRAEGKGGQEDFRASKIIDEVVKNNRGEEIGEVDDMIMGRRGKIKKVILSVGGYLGIGDRLVAVPFRSLQIRGQGEILYDVTKEKLEKHPIYSYREDGFREFYYYSPPPPYGGFAFGPPQYQGYFPYGHPYGSFPKGRYRGEYGAWGWEYYPERIRLSALLSRHLWNEAGQVMGDIDDLMINPKGKVQTIILSVGRLLGMEEKLVALPFTPLKVSGDGIVYNITEQQIKELPAFHYRGK
jgi:sporulation protein YlmC with PRC-barrel domain